MKLIALVLTCALVFAACSESTAPDYTAEKMSIASLNTTLGYDWFRVEENSYQSDTAKVRRITEAYNPDTDKFVFYVNPSCSCKGTQKLFPQTMRILRDAGITEPQIEIFSMRSASDKHPHMGHLDVKRLPTIFIVRNDVIVGSFSEQPNDTQIEDLVLDALNVQ